MMRRSNHQEEKKVFKINCNWKDIAIAIKMPETVYKRKKDKTLKFWITLTLWQKN